MKAKLLVGPGIAVLAACIATLVMIRSSLREPKARDLGPQDPRAASEVAAVRGSPRDLVTLYARWSGLDDKYRARLRIVDELVENPDSHEALAHVIDALSRDTLPLDRDPLL